MGLYDKEVPARVTSCRCIQKYYREYIIAINSNSIFAAAGGGTLLKSMHLEQFKIEIEKLSFVAPWREMLC